MASRRWTEKEARTVLSAWEQSGLSAAAFAQQRGLDSKRLYWWRRKLQQHDDRATLVPVTVTSAEQGEPVEVVLHSGHTLKLTRDFDEEVLARIVAVLERC